MEIDFWGSFRRFLYEVYPPFWDATVTFLGRYAAEVLSAYVISLVLLVLIVGRSVRRSRRVRAQLIEVEARRDRT